MKKNKSLVFLIAACASITGCQKADNNREASSAASHIETEGEKPIQHLKLPDITSQQKAVEVMKSTTVQLKSKKKLEDSELGNIHIITYSLEKAIAYFVENSVGDQQAAAKKMAEVVEAVHLNSENNRAEKTKAALDEYFKLAGAFISSGNL